MAVVALLVHPTRSDARDLAAGTVRWLAAQGHHARALFLEKAGRVVEDGVECELADIDLHGCDLAASLGGDGTFLRLAPLAASAGVPVIGVNFGKLGYLLELEPAGLTDLLERTLTGDAVLVERSVLCISLGDVPGSGDAPQQWLALNEMVLEKTVFGHTIRLATAIDGVPFLTYSADGLLVATPTGSTAYNLSAGGPVLAPALRAMVMTPVAPHLTIDRSLVLHEDQSLTVTIMDGPPAVLVVDGKEAARLAPGTHVSCRVSSEPLRIVSSGEHPFAEILAATLARDSRP